jgi:uncharacterized membrane protein
MYNIKYQGEYFHMDARKWVRTILLASIPAIVLSMLSIFSEEVWSWEILIIPLCLLPVFYWINRRKRHQTVLQDERGILIARQAKSLTLNAAMILLAFAPMVLSAFVRRYPFLRYCAGTLLATIVAVVAINVLATAYYRRKYSVGDDGYEE